MDDLLKRGALTQADAVRRGLVSSEELTRAYLARIARIDDKTSSFVHVMDARATLGARRRDRGAKKWGERPPFWGVPTAVKDLNPAKGSYTRFGSRAFERLVTPFDDATTAQLRRAGGGFGGEEGAGRGREGPAAA